MILPLISVIIPVYNVEEFLRECVDSILGQSYRNLEIILVNDGSTDKSGVLCDNYLMENNHIKVIHKENGGLSHARNAGLDICNGDYIYFIDSDDIAHPDLLMTLYQSVVIYNADVSICNYEIFRAKTPNFEDDIGTPTFKCYTNVQILEHFYVPTFGPQNVIFCNKLFKKDIWEKMRFKVGIKNEDEDLAYSLYLNKNVKKLCWTNAKLLFYRKRDDSITTLGMSLEMVYNMIYIFEEREKLVAKHKLAHLQNEIALNKAKISLFYYFRTNDKKLKKIATENFWNLFFCKNVGIKAKIFFLLKLLGLKYKSNHH